MEWYNGLLRHLYTVFIQSDLQVDKIEFFLQTLKMAADIFFYGIICAII